MPTNHVYVNNSKTHCYKFCVYQEDLLLQESRCWRYPGQMVNLFLLHLTGVSELYECGKLLR